MRNFVYCNEGTLDFSGDDAILNKARDKIHKQRIFGGQEVEY